MVRRIYESLNSTVSTIPMLLEYINKIQKDNNVQLIGTDIWDIDYDNIDDEEFENILEDRYNKFQEELSSLSENYAYVFSDGNIMGITHNSDVDELVDSLAIKEGVNYYKSNFGLIVNAYYNDYSDKLYLVPISSELNKKLSNIIDNSDFDENDTMHSILAQYSY